MSSTDTLFRARFMLPELLEQGKANILKCPVYLAGALVAPASGTISIYDPSNTAVVDAAAVTVTSSVATYSLASATIADFARGEGWRVEWTLTFTSPAEVHRFGNEAALVRNRLYPVVTEADLYRVVSALDPAKGAACIHSESSFTDKIDEAFNQLEQWLIGEGNRPNLILSPSALRKAHLYLTLSLIFEDFATRLNVAFEQRAAGYREQFRQARGEFKFLYATPADDGQAVGGAKGQRRGGPRTLWLTSTGSTPARGRTDDGWPGGSW